MDLIHVEDINSDELEIYHKIRDNVFDELNSFVADSPKVVNVLLKTDLVVKSVLATKEYYEEFEELLKSKNIPKLYLATKEQMETIVGHKIHHNCMMHGIRPNLVEINSLGSNVLMLDSITSSENIGSISRTMAALGVSSLLVPKNAPHPYGRRALRVSMGYVSKLDISVYDDIKDTIFRLKELGYRVYAAEITEDSTMLSNIKVADKWVLIMGHEGLGLADDVLKICDEVVTIEMAQDVKSLNVAVASSVLMYKFMHNNTCNWI